MIQVRRCERAGGEVLRVENHEMARLAAVVVDIGQHVTVAFRRRVRARDEDRFVRRAAFADAVDVELAGRVVDAADTVDPPTLNWGFVSHAKYP